MNTTTLKVLFRFAFGTAVLFLIINSGCRLNSMPPTQPAIDTTFYGRIGDSVGIDHIMDSLLIQLRADSAISSFFISIDTVAFKQEMGAQLCQWVGGPCIYTGTGDTMKTIHHGMHISATEFNDYISDYLNAMNSTGVADSDQDRVLNYMVSYQSDIVGQ